MKVAVIGAGVAGAACARAASDAGADVTVFDKARGPGGRAATRRVQTPFGELSVDHGAQFFTARTPGFHALVKRWVAAGVAADWAGPFAEKAAGRGFRGIEPGPRFIGRPSMNAVVKAQLEGLAVEYDAQVAAIEGEPGTWRIALEGGRTIGVFDRVVVAVPAEQAGALVAAHAPKLAAEADAARTDPTWAAMAAFEKPVDFHFNGAAIAEGPLRWIARNTSKSGRGKPEVWVAHASAEWSRQFLEEPAADVARALVDELRELTGAPRPVWSDAHRWRYAQVETATGSAFGWDAAAKIGVCGDWRLGARVELAWESGHAMGVAASGV